MSFDDCAADAQADAQPTRLRRRKCRKKVLAGIGLHSFTGIRHLNNNLAALPAGTDADVLPLAVRDCVGTIADQIEEHLLQLNEIAGKRREVGIDLDLE